MNVNQLNPVQFNTNTLVGDLFCFNCTCINMNALKMLMFQ